MPVFALGDSRPDIHETAFVAPTACIIGAVTLEAGCSVWYGTVLRGDSSPILVREGASVQDGAVLHGPSGTTTEIGRGATVAHNAVVHGAIIGEEATVGNGAIVLDGSVIGERSLVAAGSVVQAGVQLPDGVLIAGAPAEVKRPIDGTQAEVWVVMNPEEQGSLAALHRDHAKLMSDYR